MVGSNLQGKEKVEIILEEVAGMVDKGLQEKFQVNVGNQRKRKIINRYISQHRSLLQVVLILKYICTTQHHF